MVWHAVVPKIEKTDTHDKAFVRVLFFGLRVRCVRFFFL